MNPQTIHLKKKPVKGRNTQSNKKVALACGLLAIMAFMWAKVLFKSDAGPKTAEAQIMEELQEQQNQQQVKISYVELPFEAGRHDRLSSDMFGPRQWLRPPGSLETQPVAVVTERPSKEQQQYELIKKIASGIEIEAIIVGQNGSKSEAFIGNNLVSVGSSFSVSHNGREYSFTVVEISKKNVFVKWNEFKVAIGMSQPDGLE